MKTRLAILILSLLAFSCNKKKLFDGPNHYSDDFESYTETNQLIEEKNKNWSFFQNTYTDNSITLDTTFAHTGKASLKFYAEATQNGHASKASVVKQKMAFWAKDIIEIDAWYYISGNESKEWLFLMDLEEQASIGNGPGMRLAIVNDQLLLEHKYPNPNLKQKGNGITFPRNEWVNIRLEVKLSQKKKGYVKIWQNNELVISQDNWRTLPKDLLYVIQGTKGMYSSIEFGPTANTSESETILYIDDIRVKKLN